MKCLICGREYIALGVHIRLKHKMDPDSYRDEFGMLRTAPLVDPELSEVFKMNIRRQLSDPERKMQMQATCLSNAKTLVGQPGYGMSGAGKALLAGRNTARNAQYLDSKANVVVSLLREHKSIHAVRKAIGMGRNATKAIIDQGKSGYSKNEALALRLQMATATQHAKRAKRVAAYEMAIHGAESAADACRMAGISLRTYKNWLAAGVIQKVARNRL